jgi:predicted small metal-binding protein
VIPAADDEQLIARVSEHMSEAHGTFEMEEVILANASVTDREPRTT